MYAPNETDPASGVLVFIIAAPHLSDYTDQDGYFEIGEVPAGAQELQVGGGSLAIIIPIDVVAGQNNVVAPETEPIVVGEGIEVKMAVATGLYDAIEYILGTNPSLPPPNGLGFPELSSPSDPGTGYVLYGTPDSIGNISPVLSDTGLLNQYDVIFLDCGTETAPIYDDVQMNNLRDWVAAGHSLYASDWAYDFVETGWPEAIDFYDDDTVPGDATEGDSEDVTAQVLDPGLRAALGGATSAEISFNLSAWAVAEAAGTGTEVLMTADVHVLGTPLNDSPILLRFHSGQGTVIYTAFHNEAQLTTDMERILRALVFGM